MAFLDNVYVDKCEHAFQISRFQFDRCYAGEY